MKTKDMTYNLHSFLFIILRLRLVAASRLVIVDTAESARKRTLEDLYGKVRRGFLNRL